MKVIPEKRRAH